MGAFGEKLRSRREQRGLALEAISNTTKISTRMLRALEEEQFDQLPGGVFNKGFVRAYARQVGIDEEEAISDYLAALRENQIEAQKLLPDFRAPAAKLPERAVDLQPRVVPVEPTSVQDDKSDNGIAAQIPIYTSVLHEIPEKVRPPNKLPRIPESITERAAQSSNPAARHSGSVQWTKVGIVVLFVVIVLILWNSHRRSGSETSPGIAVRATGRPAAAIAVPEKSANRPTSETASLPSSANARRENQRTSAHPAAPKRVPRVATVKPPATFNLLIRAEKTTLVSIMADGKPVVQETLIAPAHTSVRASRDVVVKVGNAAGVSFALNGKSIPAHGNDGEAKTFVFDAHGLLANQAQIPSTTR